MKTLEGKKSFIVAAIMVVQGLLAGYAAVDGVPTFDIDKINWEWVLAGSGLATIREALRKGLPK